jgi:multiple sugar transport system substrate-binding protein
MTNTDHPSTPAASESDPGWPISRRALLGSVPAVGLAGLLAGCSSSSSGGSSAGPAKPLPSASLAKELKKPAEITFWAWTPKVQQEIALFTAAYPNIKINYVNAGQGAPEYTKLRTALKAGKGVPDAVQIEFQYIPTFSLQDNLLDMGRYGADAVKSGFVDWTWKQAAPGGKVYGIPWDSGPMGLLYREDIFAKYKIKPPTTWNDFATAAQKLHATAPNVSMTNLADNDVGAFLALMWQAGSRPFSSLDANNQMKLKVNDSNAKKVANFFTPLVKSGAVSTDPDFNNDWYQGLASGRYATWFSAAWGPVFLQGSAAKSSGLWRAAPLPQWDAARPASGNWGGSTIAVTKGTKFPAAATAFAMFMMTNKKSATQFSTDQFLFPTRTEVLTDPAYVNQKLPFYGGQQVNQVFAKISHTIATDFQWDPFHDYLTTSANNTFGKALSNKTDLAAGLDAWQANLVSYAKAQGIKIRT